MPLFAAAALVSGCASPDARYGSTDYRYGSVRSNEGYYAVIDSIESGPARNDGNYFIRVRFDDRSYQTVTQASLDGLRVGDSVRIERDRVRRYQRSTYAGRRSKSPRRKHLLPLAMSPASSPLESASRAVS